MLALLSPASFSCLASGFGTLFFGHVLGSGFTALAAPELAQESGRLALFFFGHEAILA